MTDETYSSWLHEVGCCFPGECCMAHTDHFRSECYTPEDAETGGYLLVSEVLRKRMAFAREILVAGNLDLATEAEAKEAIAQAIQILAEDS